MVPETRDLTLIDGVSPLPAATGNALQDQTISVRRSLSGGDLVLIDDFTGSAVDTGTWSTVSAFSGAVSIANSKIVLTPNEAAGNYDAVIASAALGIGVLPFRAACLVKLVAGFGLGDTNTGLQFGVITPGIVGAQTDANALYFSVLAVGPLNWRAIVGGIAHDTGVPYDTTNYHLLEIHRDANGVASFSIDGVLVYQAASPAALASTSAVACDCYNSPPGAHPPSVSIDLLKCSVFRYPVMPSNGPPSPTPHFESGRVAFDGATNGPDGTTHTRRVNFATTFGASGSSKFIFNATLGPGNVHTRASVSNIDANGAFMDVYVEDGTFVGPVAWQAFL